MVKVTVEPLDAASVAGLMPFAEGSGSVLAHFAVVKAGAGAGACSAIRFEPSAETEAEMREIEAAVRARWKVDDLLLIRRTGLLKVGEVISVVAVAAVEREQAFGACGEAIVAFKKMKSIRKREIPAGAEG
jgi:molybdopterin synthase catalytic subunit